MLEIYKRFLLLRIQAIEITVDELRSIYDRIHDWRKVKTVRGFYYVKSLRRNENYRYKETAQGNTVLSNYRHETEKEPLKNPRTSNIVSERKSRARTQ